MRFRTFWRGLDRKRPARRPGLESLERREVCAAGVVAAQLPPVLASGPQVFNLALNPAAGQVFVTFLDNGAGIDPASLTAGNVQLVNVSNRRFVTPLTFLATPTPNGLTRPIVGQPGVTQTVGFQFGNGRAFPAGLYRVVLRSGPGGVRNLAGTPLDGEFRGAFPSGNGVPGGTFVATVPTNGILTYLPRPIGFFTAPGNVSPTSSPFSGFPRRGRPVPIPNLNPIPPF